MLVAFARLNPESRWHIVHWIGSATHQGCGHIGRVTANHDGDWTWRQVTWRGDLGRRVEVTYDAPAPEDLCRPCVARARMDAAHLLRIIGEAP